MNDFESVYPPAFEKDTGKKAVKMNGRKRKTINGSRADMMRAAVLAADDDLESSIIQHEETTSEKLFRHLFGACNILRGPINQDE